MKTNLIIVLLVMVPACQSSPDRDPPGFVTPGLPYPGPPPGEGEIRVTPGYALDGLGNDIIISRWTEGTLRIEDLVAGETIELEGEPFQIEMQDGRVIGAGEMKPLGLVGWSSFSPDEEGKDPVASSRCAGVGTERAFLAPDLSFSVNWTATLLEGSNYIRQTITITAADVPVPLRGITFFDAPLEGARQVGEVRGCPIVVGNIFLGVEHPMAENTVGHPETRVGTWSPEEVTFPERTTLTWDLTEVMQDGPMEVLFQYTRGGHRLEIFHASIQKDGVEIGRDEHFGATGNADIDNRYRFEVPPFTGKPTFTLVAEVRSDGGTDSRGYVAVSSKKGHARARGTLPSEIVLEPRQSMSLSSIIGVAPEGQLRRGFLYYLERERAHPYRPFLHYNSWYDIGFGFQFDEAACLEVVRAYGEELVKKRGVVLDSFLFDDGWDDTGTLWEFHDGLPNGFGPVKDATAEYGSAPGVWLSPWGGYGKARKERLEAGKAAGFETNEQGFALSAPKYYEHIESTCLEMVEKYGANQFKFDGVGSNTRKYPGSRFGSDFEAAISLIGTLREARPDIYINQTTGTWPSPFWLLHADSTWRGGHDHNFTGVGTKRQQWITYRDAMTYRNVVRRSPLYPISSLMLHGVILAPHAKGLKDDPGDDLRDEIRTAFGCGTQLQELYVSPGLLSEKNWDDLAAAARWARERAEILRDVHWIGGDPEKLEVYGWAAWSPGKGTIVLRNPSDAAGSIELDITEALELPSGEPTGWVLESSYPDQGVFSLGMDPGARIDLEPFEVLVFDARPVRDRQAP